jgi:cbb3-type cytochrome oxidase subunit 3
MRLSDIVGAAHGLAVYAEIALVLFLAAFAAVVVQVLSKARRTDFREAEALPFADEETVVRSKGDAR